LELAPTFNVAASCHATQARFFASLRMIAYDKMTFLEVSGEISGSNSLS